jgi:prevent-host-death family protein
MDTPVSAAEANRAFSSLLRQVRDEGKSFVVTSHGRPVARLAPFSEEDRRRVAGRAALLARLAAQPARNDAPDWTREELYRRDR